MQKEKDSEIFNQAVFVLDLARCPERFVMDLRNPDRSVDEKYFKNIEMPLSPARVLRRWGSTFRVLSEGDGKKVLEHWSKKERCLLTGHNFWSDYAVEVKMRKLMSSIFPDFDDECCKVSRCGIVFRQETVRRYYFYCIEDFDKIILYRREDDVWTPLDVEHFAFDKNRYYWLKVECLGERIRCYLDGSKIFEVTDGTFKMEKVGIRMNTVTRIYDWKVYMSKRSFEKFERTLKRYEAEVADLSSRYPKPILWNILDG